MKTYGVNRFLVWVGLLILFCPVYLWAENVLLLPWPHMAPLMPPAMAQAFGLASCWTFLYYFIYGKILADPRAVERARQSLQQSKSHSHSRYRWPIMWVTIFAVVGTASMVSRLIFGSPSWLHVAGYSLLLPCSCLAAMRLIDMAARKGQLAQLLASGQGGSRPSE